MTKGFVDITNLLGFGVPGGLVHAWFEECKSIIVTENDHARIGLLELMALAVKKPKLQPLASQVLWHYSVALDKYIGRSMNAGAAPDAKWIASCKWQEVVGGMIGDEADRHCAKYVEASCEALNDKTEFSLPTDKAHVCHLPLQDTLIGSGNLVVVVCPNVQIPKNGKLQRTNFLKQKRYTGGGPVFLFVFLIHNQIYIYIYIYT